MPSIPTLGSLGFRLPGVSTKFKLVFFDRSIIKKNWKKMNRGPLQRAGNLIRMISRGLIKRRKLGGKPGPIGGPPRSRQPGKTPPFKMIFNDFIGFRQTAQVVGMIGFGARNPAPGLQEHGGRARRTLFVPKTTGSGRQRRRKDGLLRKSREPLTQTVRIPKRPFMFPALLKGKSRMPQFWKNSLR